MAAHSYAHTRRTLIRRTAHNALVVIGLIGVALGVGTVGYHAFADLPWLDAAMNAAMILTGMGPVSPVERPAGKVFAIGYALVSGVFFLTVVAVLLAPALHHFLHRFHLEFEESRRPAPPKTSARSDAGPAPRARGPGGLPL